MKETGTKKNNSSFCYLHLKKGDGKEWYFDCNDIKHGLVLYNPSKFGGKLIKKLVYLTECLRITKMVNLKMFGIDYDYPPKCEPAEQIIEKVFCREKDIRLSYFMGTPCAHQKETIQISNRQRILGYCKISAREEIYDLFKSEAEILAYFEGLGIRQIPKCLYCGVIGNQGFFLQDTHKTLSSKQISVITPQLVNFLEDFYEKTAVFCTYNKSDICVSISKLKNNYGILERLLSSKEYAIFTSAVDYVEAELSKLDVFYAAHRDLTPWNMYYENGRVEIFDFEYARRTYPKDIDYIHFIIQSMIYETGASVEKIVKALKFFEKRQNKDYRVSIICYIVDFISLYIVRENKNITFNIINDIKIRIKILENFLTNDKEMEG